MGKLEAISPHAAAAGAPGERRLRAAFINTGVANCSIHESGLMVHECIKQSDVYDMDYFALSDVDVRAFVERQEIVRPGAQPIPAQAYDFWVFNWHFITMAMLLDPSAIQRLPGRKFTIVLELSPGDPLELVPKDVFDGYIALDPCAEQKNGIFAFPRPLHGAPRRPQPTGRAVPVIGSFGFGTPGKGFEQLVEAVNHEFDKAVVRVNVPRGDYIGTDVVHGTNYAAYLEAMCRRIAKPGIEVRFTYDFMTPEQLIDWCGDNDLNCFMYTRRQPGLSATTDQAIISGRPLATLTNDTFRHIHRTIPPYPVLSLRESLSQSTPRVYALQEDWSREAFSQTFHRMLNQYGLGRAGEADLAFLAPSARRRVLVGLMDGDDDAGALDYGRRVADSLGRTSEFHVTRLRSASAQAMRQAIAKDRPDAVVLVGATKAQAQAMLSGFAGSAVRIARDNDGPSQAGEKVLPWRPVVPFFTVQVARAEPQEIVLIGFACPHSDLEQVVAKIGREMPSARIRVEGEATGEQWRRVRAAFAAAGLACPEDALAPLPHQDEALVQMLAAASVVYVYADASRPNAIEAMTCLAMTTERSVLFSRAAPLPAFAAQARCIDDHTVADGIALGVASHMPIRHAFGEWRLFADLRDALTKAAPVMAARGQEPADALAALLAAPEDQFLARAYQAVLGRPIDGPGQASYETRMRQGLSRAGALAALRLSAEGQARGMDWPALDALAKRENSLGMRSLRKTRRLIAKLRGASDEAAPAAAGPMPAPPSTPAAQGASPSPAPAPVAGQALRRITLPALGGAAHMLLVVGVEGQLTPTTRFVAKLEAGLRAAGKPLAVIWVPEAKAFRMAGPGDLEQLGLSGSPAAAGAADVQVLLSPESVGPGGWLLVGDRGHTSPDEPGLIDMNIILEARRLGLRAAFVFHGADPLADGATPPAVAASHETYMQTLLLADLVVTGSRRAEEDLLDFFVIHQKADAVPVVRRAPLPIELEEHGGSSWSDYARRLQGLMAEAANPMERLKELYLWAGPPAEAGEPGRARALAQALSAHGVAVTPVTWSNQAQSLATHDSGQPLPLPQHRVAGRWLLAPQGLAPDLFEPIAAFAKANDLRIAAILGENRMAIADGGEAALLTHAAQCDKVFAVSAMRQRTLFRHIFAQRLKTPRADHRFQVAAPPDAILDRPRARRPRTPSLGLLRLLIWLPPEILDVTPLADALAGVARRIPERIEATIIGGRPEVAHGLMARAGAPGQFACVWHDLETSAEALGALSLADAAIIVGAAERQDEAIRACLWSGAPALAQQDPAMSPKAGLMATDLRDKESLVDALLRLADPSWRVCLSREALAAPARTEDDYAADIVRALTQDRLSDTAVPAPPREPSDLFRRLPQLKPRPKLSLCISTYNRGPWIEVNLRNIFRQIPVPRADLEVLVVDNTSTDDTPEVVKPWLHRPDFTFIRNPKNVGMLGNLAVTAQRARGEHIWILGDDDLTREGVIEKILDLLHANPGLPLIYMNYGYSSEEFPRSIPDVPAFLNAYNMLEPPGPDVFATGKAIAAKCENFYTAIYSHVYRRDHGIKAYCQDTSGRIFATMLACIPTAYYVLHYMPDLPAYWIGEPALVVNSRVSWAAYGPMLDLEHLPASWDLAERAGCPAEEVDRRRANRLWLVKMMWRDLFENDTVGNADYIDPPKVLMRLNHLPEMAEHIGEFRDIYARAHQAGHKGARMAPEELFAGWM